MTARTNGTCVQISFDYSYTSRLTLPHTPALFASWTTRERPCRRAAWTLPTMETLNGCR